LCVDDFALAMALTPSDFFGISPFYLGIIWYCLLLLVTLAYVIAWMSKQGIAGFLAQYNIWIAAIISAIGGLSLLVYLFRRLAKIVKRKKIIGSPRVAERRKSCSRPTQRGKRSTQ
jgi:membrane protein implicated in regulation of membrane protease activity